MAMDNIKAIAVPRRKLLSLGEKRSFDARYFMAISLKVVVLSFG